MNVFRYEFKNNYKPALIWGVSIGLMAFYFLMMFPTFQNDMKPILELLKNYPQEALKALGMTGEIQSFSGFMSFIMLYPLLCGSIQALIAGIGVISKEGARKTSDFLFTKPQSRLHILLGKYAAVFVCMLISGALFTLINYIGCVVYVKEFDVTLFALMCGAFVLTQLFCLSIGFCIGCVVRRIKSPNGVGIGIGALFFAMHMVVNMVEDQALAFLSPISYLNPSYISAHQGYDPVMLAVLAVLTVGFACAGILYYKKKDIHSA